MFRIKVICIFAVRFPEMKRKSEYALRIEGLKKGTHHFDFELTEEFFENFAPIDFEKPHFKADIEMMKDGEMLVLQFKIVGNAIFACDKCLSGLNYQININQSLIVKFGDEAYEETDDILVIPTNEHEIDIMHQLYEFISLNLPLKRVCEKEGKLPICDLTVLKKLKDFVVHETKEEEIDPRWELLKKLKDNKN